MNCTPDWVSKAQELDAGGWALLPDLITADQCRQLSSLYGTSTEFRSRVVMSRHGFGRGEYQYFAYPLPDLVQELRTTLYPHLAPIANDWHERMGLEIRFPPTHAQFIERCHAAGQTKPTPLLLQYGAGALQFAAGIRARRISPGASNCSLQRRTAIAEGLAWSAPRRDSAR